MALIKKGYDKFVGFFFDFSAHRQMYIENYSFEHERELERAKIASSMIRRSPL